MGAPILVWIGAMALAVVMIVVLGNSTFAVIVRHVIARWTFQSVSGVIESSQVGQYDDSDGKTGYRPEVSYRYRVGGRDYVGKRFTYDNSTRGNGRAWAQGYMNAAQPEQEVTVYYNPRDPSDSILSLWEDPSVWVLSLVSMPFFFLGLSILCLFPVRLMRGDEIGGRPRIRRKAKKPFDGIKGWGRFRRRGDVFSIRKPAIRLMWTLIAVAVIPEAVGLPVFAYMAKGADWMITYQGAAAAVCAAVGLLALGILWQIARRGPRVTLDEANRRVTVSGHGRRTELDFRDIEAWAIDWIPSPALWINAGEELAMILSVCLRDGRRIPVHVFLDAGDGRKSANEALLGFSRATQSKAFTAHKQTPDRRRAVPERPGRTRFVSPFSGLRFPSFRAWIRYGALC